MHGGGTKNLSIYFSPLEENINLVSWAGLLTYNQFPMRLPGIYQWQSASAFKVNYSSGAVPDSNRLPVLIPKGTLKII